MNFNNIEFLNVEELETIPGMSGVRLQRYPRDIRENFGYNGNEKARYIAQRSVGCEIRFVTDAKNVRITLSALEATSRVFVFKGDFFISSHSLNAGIITTLDFEDPSRLYEVDMDHIKGQAFSSKVWRFVFSRESLITLYHVDTFGHEIRVPNKNEKPNLCMLSYGSSITNGYTTQLYTNSYIYQAAQRLHIDVLNKGLAGTCFFEGFVADYLAENNQWDLITLELGINVRERYEKELFEERARYLINTIVDKNPTKPVVVISIYPNYAQYLKDRNHKAVKNELVYNRILEEIITEKNHKNLYFIPGNEIFTEFTTLCADLLHPSDNGHIIMGENLSKKLKPIIDQLT